MTDDILTRLRNHVRGDYEKTAEFLLGLAADEIERLRALVGIAHDIAYWLENYATFDDDNSRAKTLVTCWKQAVRGE